MCYILKPNWVFAPLMPNELERIASYSKMRAQLQTHFWRQLERVGGQGQEPEIQENFSFDRIILQTTLHINPGIVINS